MVARRVLVPCVVGATLLLAVGSLTPRPAPVSAQTGVSVTVDKGAYLQGDIATLTVTGLLECAGQAVGLGLAWYSSTNLFISRDGVVAEDGSLSVGIPIEPGSGTVQAGVVGDCVPGGAIFSDQPISIFHGDPPAPGYYIKLEVDKTSYTRGEVAHFTLQGLTECAGQTILVGFFSSPDAVEFFLSTDAMVDGAGSATVKLSVDRAGTTAYAAASGECVPGGSTVSPVLVTLLDVDPPQPGYTPPRPPGSGSGLAAEPDAPVAPGRSTVVAILAIALTGVGALLVLRRR